MGRRLFACVRNKEALGVLRLRARVKRWDRLFLESGSGLPPRRLRTPWLATGVRCRAGDLGSRRPPLTLRFQLSLLHFAAFHDCSLPFPFSKVQMMRLTTQPG